jgi:hypothetical protein
MSNFENGWLAEQEAADMNALFGDPGDGVVVMSEPDAMTMIREAAKTPVMTHPWTMAKSIQNEILTVWNQDANNCAGHGTARAIEAYMLMCAWTRTRHELVPFETFVPWIWGVGKNEAGNPGAGGASMGSMLSMITQHGILRNDTPGLPPYKGTSDKWAARYGKGAVNAPYSTFWPEAKKYIVTVARLPKDDEAFYLTCKAGFAVAFGTSQKISMARAADPNRKWSASGSWMHAMAGYGYNAELDAAGIDNSHGDGFGWASRDVLKSVVTRARYFDAFAVLNITPHKAPADWSVIGRG